METRVEVAAQAGAQQGGARELRRLPLATMIGWGIGTLGPVTVLTATNALLLRFMTDFYGIGAGLAASLIAFSKIYDAFADAAMGFVSDRTQSRWGRRRPYLLLGGVLLAISILALFAPPQFASTGARETYMGAVLVFYATAYTVFNIPYLAMAAEMTNDYHERSQLMSWRVYAVGVSQIVASFAGPWVVTKFGGGGPAHVAMAAMMAPIVVGASIVCFRATRNAPSFPRDMVRVPVRTQLAAAATNRPFLVLIVVKFLTLSVLGVQSVFPYFFTRILGVGYAELGTYFLLMSLTLIFSAPLWLRVSRVLDKRATYWIALLLSVPLYLSWLVAAPGDPLWHVWLRACINGLSAGGALLMGQSLLPDTIEYDALRSGRRREGVYAGLYTTVEKLSGALGVAAVGAILSAAGYVASRGAGVVQPESALQAIRLLIALLPAGIGIAAALVLVAYPLSERRLMELRRLATAS
jgi:GPH family glycoside/pentoside/hexuronide:cation symporter